MIRAETDRPKEGKRCIRLDYNWRKAYAISEPGIAWADHEAISFWLRFEGIKHSGWKLRISAEADNGGFTIWHEIDYNFDGWAHIRLHREDWRHTSSTGTNPWIGQESEHLHLESTTA